MSELTELPSTPTYEPVLLTSEEDTFCMAVIEYGGNLGAAYRGAFGKQKKSVGSPIARAQELINRPEIALRIKKLAEATQEHALISLGSHLLQLAVLRDKSTKVGDMRTALAAEVKRGEVAGFYKDKVATPADGAKFVQINITNPTPGNMEEWAARHGGHAPVVIDMPHQ